MKRRIFKVLLLLVATALISIPFVAPIMGQNNDKTEISVQENVDIINKIMEEETELSEIEKLNNEVDAAIENMNVEMAEIESIKDKKEWFIAYKEIVDKYSYILDPPERIYDYYTDEELDMFFRVVQAEIGDEYTFEQKCNVASVILNRIEHYKFSDEMLEILTPCQFETVNNGKYKNVEVSEDTILACEYAFEVEDTTDGCLFFDSNNTLNYEFVFNDGAHNFYKYKRKEFQEYVQKEN